MAIKTYGNLYFDSTNNDWKISGADPHICIKLKAIFARIPKSSPQPFSFRDIPESCSDLLWFNERYPLKISDSDLIKLKKGKKSYVDNINDLEAIFLPDYIPHEVHLKEGYKGRDYQLKGVDVFLKCKRILIGDDLGLGKTLIAILAFLHKETLPALVTVQTHMPTQWKVDFIEKFTNLKVHIIKGTKPYELPPADVYITKYSCLAGWVNVFEKKVFKTAIFDEMQELRHDGSGKYEGAAVLSENVEYCAGLTATPIYNYGEEIFNILNIIKKDCLGDKYDFLREWGGSYFSKKIDNPEALGTYLRDSFLFLRRTRKEVGRELQQVNTIIQTIAYDEGAVIEAEKLAKMLAIKVTTGSFAERGQASRELDILVRHNTGVSKAKYVAEYIKILLENGEPVLLAGWHREVYSIWAEELKEFNPMFYTGSESPAQKEKTKQAFISGETNLMIISLRSAPGIDGLQRRGKVVVFGELDWSPKIHDQLTARLDRDGQTEQVTQIFLVSEWGSDPPMIDLLGLKASQSHNIIDPLAPVKQQHTDDSRIKLLAESFLKKKNKEKV